jgi:DNA-nicking Smr family endonuclease
MLKAPAPTPERRAAPPAQAAPPKPAPPEELDDAELFRRAVDGVKPIPDQHRRRVPKPKPAPSSVERYDEDAQALAKLAAMMDGAEPLGHEFSEEHTEWIDEEADPSILPRLRAGEYPYQAHLDLHGMTREQAKSAVFRVLAGARIQQQRSVLIVTGRGNHSDDQVPVLKVWLQRALRRGALKQWVFAFCTAQPVDGGAGATYVLLRRP